MKNAEPYYVVLENTGHINIENIMDNPYRFMEPKRRGFNNRADIRYMNLRTCCTDDYGHPHLLEYDCFSDGFYIPENLYIVMVV